MACPLKEIVKTVENLAKRHNSAEASKVVAHMEKYIEVRSKEIVPQQITKVSDRIAEIFGKPVGKSGKVGRSKSAINSKQSQTVSAAVDVPTNDNSMVDNQDVLNVEIAARDKADIEALDHSKQMRYSAAVTRLVKKVFDPTVITDERMWLKKILEGMEGSIQGGNYDVATNRIKVGIKPSLNVVSDLANDTILNHYFNYMTENSIEVSDEELLSHLQESALYSDMQKTAPLLVEDMEEIVKGMTDSVQAHALTHEFIHAATVQYIRTNPKSAITKRLESIFEQAKSRRGKYLLNKFTTVERGENYWETNLEEFVAEALSNPALMAGMMTMKISVGEKLSNMFMEFVSTVMSIFGVKKKDTMFEYMLDAFAAIVEAKVANIVSELRDPRFVQPTEVLTYEELLKELTDKTSPEIKEKIENRSYDSAEQLPVEYQKGFRKPSAVLTRLREIISNAENTIATASTKQESDIITTDSLSVENATDLKKACES